MQPVSGATGATADVAKTRSCFGLIIFAVDGRPVSTVFSYFLGLSFRG